LKLGTTVFLMVETGCQYFSELAFPDRICAGIKVRTLGRSSVTYNVGLFRGEDNIAAAQGHFVHVNVDRVTRRPTQIQMKKKLVLKKIMI